MFRILFLAIGAIGRSAVIWLLVALAATMWAKGSFASNYASVVMDARSGKILFSKYPDKILHPASLTKMMTIYVAVQAVENGEISLDDRVRISKFAAGEPASKLHLQSGSRIAFRYLIRAAAVRSANDAATAIAEAISGSEREFAARMTRTARVMGMKNTTFKNAHGLTQRGHRSTARDMTILGRHVIYDYPDYYNLFARRTTDAGLKTVSNTNRRFLNTFKGADGIKTGYTKPAGFNLVASAERGSERIIVTVFGGSSGVARDKHVAELMQRGFDKAATTVRLNKPKLPVIPFGRMTRVDVSVESAEHRRRRPETDGGALVFASTFLEPAVFEGQGDADLAVEIMENLIDRVMVFSIEFDRPRRRPDRFGISVSSANGTDGGWVIQVGSFGTRDQASHQLLKAALMDSRSLGTARRIVSKTGRVFQARFEGMSLADAKIACSRLRARGVDCEIVNGI